MSALLIRDALPEDLPAMAALTRAAYADYAQVMTPSAWAALAQAVETALATTEPVERMVAERDGRLVGSVMLYAPAADAYSGAVASTGAPEVRMLSVATEARSQGIARALMGECVRRARAAGAAEIGLHTSASMRAAIRLYEQMGFERAPERDFQPEGAELITAFRLRL